MSNNGEINDENTYEPELECTEWEVTMLYLFDLEEKVKQLQEENKRLKGSCRICHIYVLCPKLYFSK